MPILGGQIVISGGENAKRSAPVRQSRGAAPGVRSGTPSTVRIPPGRQMSGGGG